MKYLKRIVPILIWMNPFFHISVNGQSIGPHKENEGEHQTQAFKMSMLHPGYDRLSGEQVLAKWKELASFSRYASDSRSSSPWELLGPSGHQSSEGIDFVCSGRVRDIEVLNDHHIRVVSASGGLLDVVTDHIGSLTVKNLSSQDVLSSWGGTVATDPFDENIILLGTGEPGQRKGTGLWRSTDKGESWQHIPMNGGVGMVAFDEMEFTNVQGKVWTSGTDGVFYSQNSGLTWSKKRSGDSKGMVIFPNDPKTILVAQRAKGIFKTTNEGATWVSKINGLPKTDFDRIELSNCKSQPNVIYALYTTKEGFTEGIYKSVDSGENWSRCVVSDANGVINVDYHWGLAGYASFISVSPTNPDHVISGGGWYVYTIDGQNFVGPTEGQHADFHTGGWSKDGSMAYYGNDGGIFKTRFDLIWKWDHNINRLPITQFTTIAVSHTNPNAIIGGTQDNGLVYYVPSIKKWTYNLGDAGGVAFHPQDDEIIYGTIGLSEGDLTFRNTYKKGKSAAGWIDTNDGLDPSGQWWRLVRTDRNDPPTVYTQTDKNVYYSDNNGETWNKFITDDIAITSISSMRISQGEYPKIYVSGDGPYTSNCMVLDAAVWEWNNITNGLPLRTNNNDYTVPHMFVSENPSFPNRVYALMRGFGNHIKGKVLFRSDKNGTDWVNISGNLPDLPYIVMMEHPLNDQVLVVGTDEFGAFITDDGGRTWQKWDDGLPKAAFLTDFDFQKMSTDSVYVVTSTYGHSIWRRLLPKTNAVSTDDNTANSFTNHISSAFAKDGQIHIVFKDELNATGIIKICNMEGKCIFNQTIEKGLNTHYIDLPNLPSGIYVISVHQSDKMIGTSRIIVP